MKLKIAEIFYSIQGEGRWSGTPSVFLRTFGCNFKCAGFGMPRGTHTDEPDRIGENITLYKTFEDLPLATAGCDSYASWHPAFKHLSPTLDINEVVERMLALVPNNTWTQPNGQDVHLVITGGEPLLGWQRAYQELFDHPRMQDLKNLTFETNTTQELHDDFREYLATQDRFHVTWSCSPKLTVSGERWEDAIRPDILRSYANLAVPMGSEYHLKFVVASSDDVSDVDRAVGEYRDAGVEAPVYLMPQGGIPDQYHFNTKQVAELALEKGYRYSPRLHVDIWRNAWGT